jgi:hypothetical protein
VALLRSAHNWCSHTAELQPNLRQSTGAEFRFWSGPGFEPGASRSRTASRPCPRPSRRFRKGPSGIQIDAGWYDHHKISPPSRSINSRRTSGSIGSIRNRRAVVATYRPLCPPGSSWVRSLLQHELERVDKIAERAGQDRAPRSRTPSAASFWDCRKRWTRFCGSDNRNGVHIAGGPFVCETEWQPRKP